MEENQSEKSKQKVSFTYYKDGTVFKRGTKKCRIAKYKESYIIQFLNLSKIDGPLGLAEELRPNLKCLSFKVTKEGLEALYYQIGETLKNYE